MHPESRPNQSQASNRRLERFAQLLDRQLCGRIRGLRVCHELDGLCISGRCRSYYDKQLAQHVAAKLSGLAVVDNRIDVDSTGMADVERGLNDSHVDGPAPSLDR